MIGALHVIIDVQVGIDPLVLLDDVLTGGAPVVQLRTKGLTHGDTYALSAVVADRCRKAGVICIINDHVDIALAVDADGVHVGETDLPVSVVRRLVGPTKIVGGTARDVTTAQRHEIDGATYVGVGPAYTTTTKFGLPDPLGAQRVGEIAGAIGIPVIAIGGITPTRVPALIEAGCHGVAVVGAVGRSADPASAVHELRAALFNE